MDIKSEDSDAQVRWAKDSHYPVSEVAALGDRDFHNKPNNSLD
jgi:hypothetical protein